MTVRVAIVDDHALMRAAFRTILESTGIAADLGVGEATAKTHVSRVIAKLGVRDRVQAVILAYESGFVASGHQLG